MVHSLQLVATEPLLQLSGLTLIKACVLAQLNAPAELSLTFTTVTVNSALSYLYYGLNLFDYSVNCIYPTSDSHRFLTLLIYASACITLANSLSMGSTRLKT